MKGPADISSQPPYGLHSFHHRYVSTHNRARIVSVLLMACAVFSLAAALVSLLQVVFPDLALTDADEAINDPTILVVALLQFGLGLIQLWFT